MRWTRRQRRMGELPGEHQVIAISEVSAHLEELRLRGLATASTVDGARRYAPVSAGRADIVGERPQFTMSTSVSATQAGLFAPPSITYFVVRTAPAGDSVISVRVTVARSVEPTGTGAGNRTLLTP